MENGYREITVKYLVNEDQYRRLCRITELFKERGTDCPPEQWFDTLMTAGCRHDIDEKLRYTEQCFGIAAPEGKAARRQTAGFIL